MSFVIVICCLALLVVLISYFKVDTFLSFVLVSAIAAILLGIPLEKIPSVVNKGIGSILGELTLIIVLGAMLGKLVAESGAAQKIADVVVGAFGVKHIQWGLMMTGFIVGIPLFYGIGFVLLVPIIFSIVYQYRLPAVYVGLPMLAALSVAHGFLPPHPSPVALATMFNANLGMTLILGGVIAIPAIIIAGPLYCKTLKRIETGPLGLFVRKETKKGGKIPGKINSFMSATLPVFLLILVTLLPYCLTGLSSASMRLLSFVGSPSIAMFVSLLIATYTLGICQGYSMTEVMNIYVEAVKDIAMILLIIAGSGIFKEVMEESGVSLDLARTMGGLAIPPLILGWGMAGIIRGCVGSATVAALTAATVIMPLVKQTGVNPNLMVLALGAGSLLFSHVNDSGFWLFKEYFNLSIKDTLRSWSMMEIIVSVIGLVGVLILNLCI